MGTREGLDGVVIGSTRLSRVQGDTGRLTYSGYDIEDLAANASYEEVCGLLWTGSLPDTAALERLTGQFRAALTLDDRVLELVRLLSPMAHPMAVLRTALSAIGCLDPDAEDLTPAAERGKAVRLTAQGIALTAAIGRIRAGRDVAQPAPDQGLAASFLYMLRGSEADPVEVRALDIALILHAEHGINASTFAARVAAATRTDMHSAVIAGVSALKGPLHGGANENVMAMLGAISTPERAAPWVRDALDRGERVPGFGHRMYRTVDPRAPILEDLSRDLQERAGDTRWLDISRRVRDTMAEEMGRRGKPVFPNVDFYSASVYGSLGIPAELFPCMFACARMPGWTAHIMEQREQNRLIRPRAEYTGPQDLKVAPIGSRARVAVPVA